jgi:hypothetical protein
MSNFYYCNDCKKHVIYKHEAEFRINNTKEVCKECEGTNWKEIIDSPNGEPKEKIEPTKITLDDIHNITKKWDVKNLEVNEDTFYDQYEP